MIRPPRWSNGARQFLHRSFAGKALKNRRRVRMTFPSMGPLRKADQISSGVGFEGKAQAPLAIRYAPSAGRTGRENQSGRRSPPGFAGRAFASHSR